MLLSRRDPTPKSHAVDKGASLLQGRPEVSRHQLMAGVWPFRSTCGHACHPPPRSEPQVRRRASALDTHPPRLCELGNGSGVSRRRSDAVVSPRGPPWSIRPAAGFATSGERSLQDPGLQRNVHTAHETSEGCHHPAMTPPRLSLCSPVSGSTPCPPPRSQSSWHHSAFSQGLGRKAFGGTAQKPKRRLPVTGEKSFTDSGGFCVLTVDKF